MPVSAQDVSRNESILTPLALSGLLEWLDDGADSHGERYLEMHRRLVSYFDLHNRLAADALADETLRRIADALQQPGLVGTTTPARHCYVVAKGVLLEDTRRERRPVDADEAPAGVSTRPAGLAGSDDGLTSGERRDCLDRCLQELRTEERELVVEYYRVARRPGTGPRGRMAERLGISENALGISAVRIREALMNSVTACWRAPR